MNSDITDHYLKSKDTESEHKVENKVDQDNEAIVTIEDPDWQNGKSLAECNREMLKKEIGCDVTFKVGPPGKEMEQIRAHKYMLICRSIVFADLFNNGDISTVVVTDMEASVFKQIVR